MYTATVAYMCTNKKVAQMMMMSNAGNERTLWD